MARFRAPAVLRRRPSPALSPYRQRVFTPLKTVGLPFCPSPGALPFLPMPLMGLASLVRSGRAGKFFCLARFPLMVRLWD